jgi:hypothetical protein
MSQPPRRGPTAAVIALKPDHVPMARPPPLFLEQRREESQAPRHQEGRGDPLGRPRRDQLPRVHREAARHRGQGEPGDTHEEDPAPAEAVPQRAANQEQGGEEQRVRLDDPLHLGHRGPEVRLERGQGDVDRRSVDEGHAGAQDRRRQHPPFRSFAARSAFPSREDRSLVARRRQTHGGVTDRFDGRLATGLPACGRRVGVEEPDQGQTEGTQERRGSHGRASVGTGQGTLS